MNMHEGEFKTWQPDMVLFLKKFIEILNDSILPILKVAILKGDAINQKAF